MTPRRLRVGLVGLQPGRSWGATTHVAALRAIPEDFEIVGVANTSRESAERAAGALSIPRAFSSVAELIASPDVDVVSITVKVPHHFEIAKAAIDAGKHLYCEWPLGRNLREAELMADLARQAGVHAVVGTQARLAPEIVALRDLVHGGHMGDVLSSTIVGSGLRWGPDVDAANVYLLDNRNGANLLTIPVGHTLAAVRDVLGEVVEVSARLISRRKTAVRTDTGEQVPMTAHDQVLCHAVLESGAPLSIHFRGGRDHGTGLLWEVNGTRGDAQLSGAIGHPQMVKLSLRAGDGKALSDVVVSGSGFPAEPAIGNVARLYSQLAADLRRSTALAPSFDDAVAVHRILAAIEKSAANWGCSVTVG